MNKPSRRALIKAGIAASGIAAMAEAAKYYELIPPDYEDVYGVGETLNYAVHRITSHSLAREFPRSAISKDPYADEVPPLSAEFRRLESGGFLEWRVAVDGLVDRPASLSVAQIKAFPSRSQITQIACEEGWSYIAEWIGTPLSAVLESVGVQKKAKYLVYFSIQKDWWDSIDLTDALHPQTLLTYGMNGGALPVGNGGPLRLRVPRQLGYKSVKFINRMTLTDNIRSFGQGSVSPETGYTWYAGI